MNTGPNPLEDQHARRPDGLASGLRGLRVDVPLQRDLWPGLAARLARSPTGTPAAASPGAPAARRARPRHAHALRNVRYAAAAAMVLAAGVGWQLWPGAVAPVSPPPAPEAIVATGTAADTDAPLLRAADGLAREYQGALREVASGNAGLVADAGASGPTVAVADLDAELARSATEVRAALARDPDALHLLQRLQRIYAHRLALSLRQA